MSSISLVSHQISFRVKEGKRLRTWIERVIIANHKFPSELQFIFCNDAFLADMNKKYLKHNSLTDIITFNYNSAHYISGDIFISIERVKENAEKLNVPFEEEIQRVMIHGVLHLLGFNDKSDTEKRKMQIKENDCLEILQNT